MIIIGKRLLRFTIAIMRKLGSLLLSISLAPYIRAALTLLMKRGYQNFRKSGEAERRRSVDAVFPGFLLRIIVDDEDDADAGGVEGGVEIATAVRPTSVPPGTP